MASIHEVKDNKGKVKSYNVSFRLKDKSGKIKQSMKRGFKKKKDAETFKRSVETDFHEGVIKISNKTTVSQLLDEWNKDVLTKLLALGKLAQNTVNGYRVNIRHIKDGIGDHKLADLETCNIEDFYINLHESGNSRTGEPLSAASIAYIHTNLRSALSFGLQKHYLKFNPAIGAAKVAKELRQPRICSTEEIDLLRGSTIDTDLEMPVYLALSLGLRRGEVLGLKWDRIDFIGNTVRIEEQWAQTSSGYAFSRLKTKYSRRTIPMDAPIKAELLKFKQKQDLIKIDMGSRYDDHGLVCCQKDGTPFRPEYSSQAFSRLVDKLKIDSLRFHDLRHTFASRALSGGVSLFMVSRMLGHASISITADIYGHPTDEAFRQGASTACNAIWAR